MLNQENIQKIKQEISEFFEKMNFEVEVEVLEQKESTLPIEIKAEEPQILIGEGGQTLLEIQHLLKAIIKRKILTDGPFYIDLDINDYKKKKTEHLKEIARSLADEVVLTKKEKALSPMPAYERRIIHLELADHPNVATESLGEGPERRIIIKPK